jgi:Protein of unknown function (DUF3703)
MDYARAAVVTGDIALAKRHLERAHILGQHWQITYMKTHFHMLRLVLKVSDAKEVRGQIARLLGAGPFHIAGWVPIGNTGGADFSPTLPMPMPSDLQSYFEGNSLRNGLMVRGTLLAAFVASLSLLLLARSRERNGIDPPRSGHQP